VHDLSRGDVEDKQLAVGDAPDVFVRPDHQPEISFALGAGTVSNTFSFFAGSQMNSLASFSFGSMPSRRRSVVAPMTRSFA
jgi:hypothetical protein